MFIFPPFPSNLRRAAAFSLIELLVSMGIIAVLLSATVPALLSSQRDAALTKAGNMLADMAALARQTAWSKNTITALVVVEKKANFRQPLVVLEFDTSTESWKPLGGWVRLPDAAAVVDLGTAVQAQCNAKAQNLAPLSLQTDGVAVENTGHSVLLFYPDGRMENVDEPVRRLSARRASENSQAASQSLGNSYDLVVHANSSAFRIVRR